MAVLRGVRVVSGVVVLAVVAGLVVRHACVGKNRGGVVDREFQTVEGCRVPDLSGIHEGYSVKQVKGYWSSS